MMHQPCQPPIETPEELLANYQWAAAQRVFAKVEERTGIVIDADGDDDSVTVNVGIHGQTIEGLACSVHDKLLEAAKAIREAW
jgi:hypothetical protein